MSFERWQQFVDAELKRKAERDMQRKQQERHGRLRKGKDAGVDHEGISSADTHDTEES